MATKLLLLTILIGLCFGYEGVHQKHHNERLMKKERTHHRHGISSQIHLITPS